MIPLRDRNPSGTFPAVTITLIVACVGAFLLELAAGPRLNAVISSFGLVPGNITYGLETGTLHWGAAILPFFTSMFLHGGWLHLIGNMWFLWIFGDNVEDTLGSFRFLLFYLVCGLAAGATHYALSVTSNVPTIGASGAIAGVLGGYAVLFPGARVLTLVPLGFFWRVIELPAWVVLGLWFLLQAVSGFMTQGAAGGGVAWWAHVGGFVAGLILVRLLAPRRVVV
ncbi:MAG: rhomboid family intramembrane serine protease [Candidatus Eiseniibacteriota bacterium]